MPDLDPDKLDPAEMQQRIAMILALAAENPPDDIDALPDDFLTLVGHLDTPELHWLIFYLGGAAVAFFMERFPTEQRNHPMTPTVVGQFFRQTTLGFAVKGLAGE